MADDIKQLAAGWREMLEEAFTLVGKVSEQMEAYAPTFDTGPTDNQMRVRDAKGYIRPVEQNLGYMLETDVLSSPLARIEHWTKVDEEGTE